MSRVDPDALVSELRQAGLKVRGYGKWQRRDSSGGWNPRGILNHHTASGASAEAQNRLLANGRAGLPGPLCHISIARDGTVWMIGWGNANHAGLGDADVLRAIINEAKNLPSPNRDSADGNESLYGIEVQNNGTGQAYPRAQVHALLMTNTVIMRMHGWTERSAIHHKEWTRRKIDMSWRGDLRPTIAKYRDGNFVYGPRGIPAQKDEDYMPLTNRDADLIVDRLLSHRLKDPTYPSSPTLAAWIVHGHVKTSQELAAARTAVAELAALRAAVASLAIGGELTKEQVEASATAGARAALAELGERLSDGPPDDNDAALSA